MHNQISRRAMLGVAAGAAFMAEDLAGAAAAVPIIDTHQHLWDFKLFHPPWLKGEPILDKSMTMADYLKATEGLNVRKTVYMEVDVAPDEQLKEAHWVDGVCRSRKTPMAAAVVSCRPGKPGFDVYANELHNSPYIRGMRQVLHGGDTPAGTCLQPEYVRDIQLLGRLGMTFDICIRPAELADGYRLADKCPDTRFILDHCGNGAARNPDKDQWERDIKELSKRANVVCKISGIIRTVKPGWDAVTELSPIVHHCIESFGIDRVMFGGDWPVCTVSATFAEWVACLKAIVGGSSAADQRKLFHDNAARFYRLA